METTALNLLLVLMIKHFIVDFLLQAHPYQYLNKGIYGHPGGLLHSGLHGFGTLVVLSQFLSVTGTVLLMAAADFFLHYHIDFVKMNLGRIYNLKPNNSEWFWILLGLDQFLHFLTYYWIVRSVL